MNQSPPLPPPVPTPEYAAMEERGKKITRWLWFIAGAIVLYIIFVGNDRGGDCGPYNVSKEACKATRSMTKKELQESVEEYERLQRRVRQ